MAIKPKSKVYPRDIEENDPTKETLYDKVQKGAVKKQPKKRTTSLPKR